MMKSVLRFGMTCLAFGLLACPGGEDEEDAAKTIPISSANATLAANTNLANALHGVIDSTDFMAESDSISNAMNRVVESESCDCPFGGCSSAELLDCEANQNQMAEARDEAREGADEFIETLREKILIPANLVEETETSATYKVGPDVLCDEEYVDGGSSSASSTQPRYDAECVADIQRLNPRLRLTSPGEGDVDVAVQVGEKHIEPFTIQLHKNSLGLKVDLAKTLEAATELGDDDWEDVTEMSGVVELRLTQNKAKDYDLELDVESAVSLELQDDAGPVSISLAPTSPAVKLHLDGNARSFSSAFDLGALTVNGPLGVFADDDGGEDELGNPLPARTYTGALEMVLAGLSGTLDYTADGDVINLRNLGLGDKTSTLSHDGKQLLGIDLNAAAGRHVDVKLEAAADGSTKISVTPSFDLKVALAFKHVANQLDDLEDWMLDNTVHALFNGSSPAIEVSEDADVVRVVSGNLTLESTAHPTSDVSAAAGMCLTERSLGESEDAPPGLFGEIEAASCQ